MQEGGAGGGGGGGVQGGGGVVESAIFRSPLLLCLLFGCSIPRSGPVALLSVRTSQLIVRPRHVKQAARKLVLSPLGSGG